MSHISPNYEHAAIVSPGFTDNENTRQFSTIQAAINWQYNSSWYAGLGGDDVVAVIVYPGIYKEQLTCWDKIAVMSLVDSDNIGNDKSVQIRPPDDKKTEPMLVSGSAYAYYFSGITFKADSVEHGPYAKSTYKALFYNCLFDDGSFEDGDAAYACGLNCYDCTFQSGTPAINYTGARGHESRGIYMTDTYGYGDIIIQSTFATGSPILDLRLCSWIGKIEASDTWNVKLRNCRLRNYEIGANRNNFDTSGDIDITYTQMSGGINFVSNPNSFSAIRCNFNELGATAITGADITADVNITNVTYNNNIQQNGISGKIQTACPVKSVGCASLNRYFSIQDAIDSIVTEGVIDLRESLTGLAELTIPTGVNVTIDGHKLYSLSFTADTVELNANEELIFYGLAQLNGGNIEVNGNSAYVGFEECLTINGYVTLTAGTGTYCLVYSSTVKAPTGHPAITLNNINSIIVSGYSRIDGGIGHPAILVTAEGDGHTKLKFSTILHGDGAGNAPLVYTGLNKLDIAVYNCALNAAWSAATFTNLIGSPNNTTSPEIDF